MDGTLELLIGLAIGILACVIAAMWVIGQNRSIELLNFVVELQNSLKAATDRISVLEKRKTVLTEAAVSQDRAAGVGKRTLRPWNEDAKAAD